MRNYSLVHRPPLLLITNRFPLHLYYLRCLREPCRFASDDLWNAVVCFQPPSLLIGKIWVPVTHFCACRIYCKVHWRVGRRLISFRLISAQPLTRSIIREFCISSVMWVLEALCCLYWHSFYQIDHSTLWLTVVGVNWLTSCQECRRAVFWADYCSFYIPTLTKICL